VGVTKDAEKQSMIDKLLKIKRKTRKESRSNEESNKEKNEA
jgi:hypothetical protein